MPRNDNSVYHRMRMLNLGEEIRFPYSDYNKVKAAKHALRRDFGSNVTYYLVGELDDPNRQICVFRPIKDDGTDKRSLEAKIQFHKNNITYHTKGLLRLNPNEKDEISKWILDLIKKENGKKEEENNDKV